MSTIKEAVDDLLNPQLAVHASMDAHFAPAFRQRVNGSWTDRAAFLEGFVRLREMLAQAKVTVLDELADGEHYAERHLIDLVMRDGAVAHREVYVFAQRDSHGRFVCIEEATIAVIREQDSLIVPSVGSPYIQQASNLSMTPSSNRRSAKANIDCG